MLARDGLRRVSTFALIVGLAAGAGLASGTLERIDWSHPTLSLYLSSVGDAGDRARLELCVSPKPGVSAGSTTVGYPRYRTAGGRWVDCVTQNIGPGRSLQVSDGAPACMAILVSREARVLSLPLGGERLELELERWLATGGTAPAPAIEVNDAWSGEAAVAEETSTPEPSSDVEDNVPRSLHSRPTGLAVVLGVEAYTDAPPATYAAADARTAARYFEHALGIPPQRIELLLDGEVTLGQFQRLFGEGGWLARRTRPDSEIFVFFAGHGMAELEEFSPYILPVDADPNYIRQTALPVDRLIQMVSALGARSTTLFLDACFGARSREGATLLTGARPLVIVPVRQGHAGVSVFSAGAGNQVASALEAEGHGLFSYHLFKGLSGAADLDADRHVNAGELKGYLEEAVPHAAETLDREQFPAIHLDDPAQLLVALP